MLSLNCFNVVKTPRLPCGFNILTCALSKVWAESVIIPVR